jgi:hypothetical protein
MPAPSSYSMLCMNVVGSHTVPGGPGGDGGGYGPPPSAWANVNESPGDAPSGGCTALYSTAGRPSGPKKSCGRSRRWSVSVPPPTRSTSVVYAGVSAYLQADATTRHLTHVHEPRTQQDLGAAGRGIRPIHILGDTSSC